MMLYVRFSSGKYFSCCPLFFGLDYGGHCRRLMRCYRGPHLEWSDFFNFVFMGQKTASHGYLFDRGVRYFEYRSAFFLFSKEKGCFWFSPLPIHARPRQFTVESVASSVVMATFDCRRKVRKKLPCSVGSVSRAIFRSEVFS